MLESDPFLSIIFPWWKDFGLLTESDTSACAGHCIKPVEHTCCHPRDPFEHDRRQINIQPLKIWRENEEYGERMIKGWIWSFVKHNFWSIFGWWVGDPLKKVATARHYLWCCHNGIDPSSFLQVSYKYNSEKNNKDQRDQGTNFLAQWFLSLVARLEWSPWRIRI